MISTLNVTESNTRINTENKNGHISTGKFRKVQI